MTLRIGTRVEYGEIDNRQHNMVYGFFKLQGERSVIRLHLTGNCDADLVGRHIRFTNLAETIDSPGSIFASAAAESGSTCSILLETL